MQEGKIELHKKYWNRSEMAMPITTFRIGDFFFSRHFKAAQHLMVEGKVITPELINVDSFMEDYERMFEEISDIDQTGYWTADPFTGIPWMEAILGCEIKATKNSFISEPWFRDIKDFNKLKEKVNYKWFDKYMEFVDKLTKLSRGRFPVGEPIMRGVSDMIGAITGQMELIYMINECPETIRNLGRFVTEMFLKVINEHLSRTNRFYGGYSIGFFHLWSPGKCMWFQEDLSALLSPDYYKKYIKEYDEKLCKDFEYTAIHLHPSSLFILDELLTIESLKVIEIHKDIGGPTVNEMMGHIRKAHKKKNIIIWGALNEADIDTIWDELPHKGIHLSIVSETLDRAKQLMGYIASK